MKYSSGPTSLNLKLTLVLIGAAIAIATMVYTQSLVTRLQQREKEIVQLYAKGLEFTVNTESVGSDLNFIFNNIITRIDFPLILTDSKDQLTFTEIGVGYRNINHDKNLSKNEILSFEPKSF